MEVVEARHIDLTIVGPEAPLAAGLADALRSRGHAVFGPSQAAARIESSKAFAKDVMQHARIPTAASRTFTDLDPALVYIKRHAEPLVVKASGLAGGKGAVVCATRDAAARTVHAMLAEGAFGNAGRGIARGAGQVSFDFSLNKNVYFAEGRFVQLRLETFNAFNRANFGLPGHLLGAAGFGVVDSASEGRIIQLGLRIVF